MNYTEADWNLSCGIVFSVGGECKRTFLNGRNKNMLKSPQINITTHISLVPFWQLESKEVHVFATTESAEKEQPPTYNYVFSKYTLEKPVIIIQL